MNKKINIPAKGTENEIWKQITGATLGLAGKTDLIKERNFYGDFEDADAQAKLWKQMSKDVIRLCFAHKSIRGIKHFLDKNKLFHNGYIIHPSCSNLFSLL